MNIKSAMRMNLKVHSENVKFLLNVKYVLECINNIISLDI